MTAGEREPGGRWREPLRRWAPLAGLVLSQLVFGNRMLPLECRGDGIARRHRLCGSRRPFGDMPDRRTDGGHSDDRSLEHDERSGLVQRRHQEQMRRFGERSPLSLRHEAMKRDRVGQSERRRERLHFPVQGVFADEIEVEMLVAVL